MSLYFQTIFNSVAMDAAKEIPADPLANLKYRLGTFVESKLYRLGEIALVLGLPNYKTEGVLERAGWEELVKVKDGRKVVRWVPPTVDQSEQVRLAIDFLSLND